MLIHDKILLRKRVVIEAVNDRLKTICRIEHTRHHSFVNFITNPTSGLIACNLMPKKPSINLEILDKDKLSTVA
jgi:hypothetical protein